MNLSLGHPPAPQRHQKPHNVLKSIGYGLVLVDGEIYDRVNRAALGIQGSWFGKKSGLTTIRRLMYSTLSIGVVGSAASTYFYDKPHNLTYTVVKMIVELFGAAIVKEGVDFANSQH